MKVDFFKEVKQWDMEIDGSRAMRPVFYYNSFSMTAMYTASTKQILKYLPHPDMHPVEMLPGRSLVGFTAFEYRKSDLGKYNEFSIAFLIKWGGKGIPGFTMLNQMMSGNFSVYVRYLPVTNEEARYGGVALYGLPKFLADVNFNKNDSSVTCEVSEGKNKILSFTGSILKTSEGKVSKIKMYSLKDGIPLVTNVHTNQMAFAKSSDKNSARIEIGNNHLISTELKNINLSGSPLFYQYIPVNESILFPAKNIIDD